MIVVTGMHRSGTSAIAMTLEACGVDFGDHAAFYGADEWNERGYFERRDVIDLNSRLLTGFPRTQGRIPALLSQVGYLLLPSRNVILRRARRLRGEIAALAGTLGGMAVKDPRFSLTLPAWEGFVTSAVVCLRHPDAVAASLQRRQRVPQSFSLRFWNRHAEALLEVPPDRSLYVDYDALSGEETRDELSRLLKFLDLDVPVDDALAAFRQRFSPQLRHHVAAGTDRLPAKTRRLWDALQERRRR